MPKAKPMSKDDIMIERAKAFAKRRNAVLEKRSLDALIEFIETDEAYDGDPIREDFIKQPRGVQEFALCDIIDNCTSISKETKEWSKKHREELRKKYSS